MKKLALLAALALAFTACADREDPLAIPLISENLEATSEAVWFTSTPPDPAYFVQTGNIGYEASADAVFDDLNFRRGYLMIEFFDNRVGADSDACGVFGPWLDHDEEEARTLVAFLAPGTCIITARVTSGQHAGAEASQTFEIIEPLTPVQTPDQARIPAPRGNRPQ
jgi:hypothetical protein